MVIRDDALEKIRAFCTPEAITKLAATFKLDISGMDLQELSAEAYRLSLSKQRASWWIDHRDHVPAWKAFEFALEQL